MLAGKIYGIPISGTMAHSYVSSFGNELEAFRAFSRSFPERTVLLIDTYDTLSGAHNAALVGQEMAQTGQRLVGVRLDSGDIATLSRQVRDILDRAGLADVKIFASGGLDEHELQRFSQAGAPIDGYGIGTSLTTSSMCCPTVGSSRI